MVGNVRKQVKARRKVTTNKLIGCNNGESSRQPSSPSPPPPPIPEKKNGNILVSSALLMSPSEDSKVTTSQSAVSGGGGGDCIICGTFSTLACSVCSKVFYCGKVHQKKHWNEGHKADCFPCEEMSPEEQQGLAGPLGKGPYMKATKDLLPMEKIFDDRPLMTGPGCCGDLPYEPVCLGCTDLIDSSRKCSNCHWPLCGPKCEKDTLHAKYECEIFASSGVQELNDPFQYELVRILRCLLTRSKEPKLFEKLMLLDAALEHRRVIDSLIEATRTVTMFVQQCCKLSEFDSDTINHMSGVVNLQTQPSGAHRSSMQIFTFPTKLAHACDANTRYVEVIRPNGENLLQVVASRHIKKGEPLTQRLLLGLEPTFERQKFLMEHYYFQCKCSLCEDRTEKGTYFSGVACPICIGDSKLTARFDSLKKLCYLLPLTPTDLKSAWRCDFCDNEFAGRVILKRLASCENEYWKFKYEYLQTKKSRDAKIIAIRKKIAEFEKVLHPNNFIVWKLKQFLFNKLTERILLMLPPPTWENFCELYTEMEKLAYCVMTVVHSLQPGLTLVRGRSLHDMAVAYWGYIQWAVWYGKAASFKGYSESSEFYKVVKETVAIFEPEVTGIRKVIDSVLFMRDHVHEISLRMQKLGKVRKVVKNAAIADSQQDVNKQTP